MKICEVIAAGTHHLQQNRMRAGLSILGIFIGIASVLCMMAIGDGAKKIITDNIKRLGGPNHIQFLTRTAFYRRRSVVRRTTERYTTDDAHAIEAGCPSVTAVLPRNLAPDVFATYKGREFRPHVEGATPGYEHLMSWHIQEGRFISDNDIEHALQVCVLGANVTTELFGDTSPLGQEVEIRFHNLHTPVRMRVVGKLIPRGRNLLWLSLDDAVCIPLTTFQQRVSGKRHVDGLIVFFKKGEDINRVTEDVKVVLRKRHRGKDDFIYPWVPKRNIKRLEHIENVIKIALGGIACFSLFVSGIGIMNICLVSVGEKTREIGLRKSVGARRIDIFYQFLTESVCLCLCGGVLGIAGGWLAAHGMARVAVRILPIVDVWPVVLSVPWIVISVLFSIFMGITFGVYPALRASRMAPIDALRTDI